MINGVCLLFCTLLSIHSLFAGIGLHITHIANAGFLLEGNEKKVIIDGIFGPTELGFCDTPTHDALKKMSTAQPPFDRIDLVLVTHAHVDHMDASLLSSYLAKNTQCHMAGTHQAIEELISSSRHPIKERLHAITPEPGQSRHLELNGIEVDVFRLKHCDYFVTDPNTGEKVNRHKDKQNVGFVIHLAGQKILHIGDSAMDIESEFAPYGFDKMNLDIAMLGSLVWEPVEPRIQLVNNMIKPKHIILMHLNKGDKTKYTHFIKTHQEQLPPVILFQNLMSARQF